VILRNRKATKNHHAAPLKSQGREGAAFFISLCHSERSEESLVYCHSERSEESLANARFPIQCATSDIIPSVIFDLSIATCYN